jgi:hypothetical protein
MRLCKGRIKVAIVEKLWETSVCTRNKVEKELWIAPNGRRPTSQTVRGLVWAASCGRTVRMRRIRLPASR